MNEIYQICYQLMIFLQINLKKCYFEVNQQIILAGLYQGGFFEKQLLWWNLPTHFHGLNRFSEDMDFSLLNKDESFDFSQYFQPIIDEFDAIGRRVDIQKKDKKNLESRISF